MVQTVHVRYENVEKQQPLWSNGNDHYSRKHLLGIKLEKEGNKHEKIQDITKISSGSLTSILHDIVKEDSTWAYQCDLQTELVCGVDLSR